jgi:hypothetical protein
MTDILSTNDSLFTKNDMIMTDNGYYANMNILHTGGADTGRAHTGKADTGDKVSDNYKNLGFPALYLYTINDSCYKQNDNEIMPDDNEIMPDDNEIMPDELYNKLISLAEMKPVVNKKYTRNKKNINKQNIKKNKGKKTRRNQK